MQVRRTFVGTAGLLVEESRLCGRLQAGLRDRPVAVRRRVRRGGGCGVASTWMLYNTTDNNGEFSSSTGAVGITLEPGRYTVQVFTGGSSNAAETESEIREINLVP